MLYFLHQQSAPLAPDLFSVEFVAFSVCDEIEAAIIFPELDEGVGPALTSVADRKLVDKPSLEANDTDNGEACSAELTISIVEEKNSELIRIGN